MSEHILHEEHNGSKHVNLKEKAEELRQKAIEIEEQMTGNLNSFMNNTAENLETASKKMSDAAKFFRERNAKTLKEDVSKTIKKNPVQTIGGALLVGFLIGKIIFK